MVSGVESIKRGLGQEGKQSLEQSMLSDSGRREQEADWIGQKSAPSLMTQVRVCGRG